VRDKEEVELSILCFGLLNEALVDISTWWRVDNLRASLFEDALSDSLVDDDQGDLRHSLSCGLVVLFSADLLQLLEFVLDNHCSHGISYTISVDEDVLRHCTFVVVSISSEGAFIVLLQDISRDDLSALDRLGTGLGIVLAEVRIIGSNVTDDTLPSLMADINSDKHCLL
jgi:hypothetical protein